MPVAVAQHASRQNSDGATIQGVVLNSDHKLVDDASVRLEQKDTQVVVDTRTNAAGVFRFSALETGSYMLSAEKSGLHGSAAAVIASPGDSKRVDLVLQASPSSTQAMEFADKPNFTVAGVTDWTAAGGHGSDTRLRTSEALARETLTLKADGPGPANHGAEYDRALALKQAGDFSQAREQVRKILEHENNADLHRLLGELDEKLGDPLAAVHEYQQAVRLEPSEENYFQWGSELLLHRAVWQAKEVFSEGAEAYPKSARMLTALGTTLFASGLYDQAALRVCDASDLNPEDPAPYLFLGKIEKAAPIPLTCVEPKLARFAREQPENAAANYFYAIAVWKRHSPQENQQASHQVETLLTKAVTIDPKYSDAYLQLGILYFAQNNIRKAIACYLKAIEANSQLGEAHYRLGVAYDRVGESAKAKQEFEFHEEIEKRQAAAVELQRREVKQFLIVLQSQTADTPAH
jgi:tetratricopeptide (TPR) repeat protein